MYGVSERIQHLILIILYRRLRMIACIFITIFLRNLIPTLILIRRTEFEENYSLQYVKAFENNNVDFKSFCAFLKTYSLFALFWEIYPCNGHGFSIKEWLISSCENGSWLEWWKRYYGVWWKNEFSTDILYGKTIEAFFIIQGNSSQLKRTTRSSHNKYTFKLQPRVSILYLIRI